MGENSQIEWCDHTFNPWIGCCKVSEGCANCYAEAMMDHRLGRVRWGDRGIRHRTSHGNWIEPEKWDGAAKAAGKRARVFCASLADVLEDRSELNWWREELWALIRRTPNLQWMLLTKRPENAARMIPEDILGRIWLGASVENQKAADARIPHLLAVNPAVRFLSCEPLLGPVDLTGTLAVEGRMNSPHIDRIDATGLWMPHLNWIICGGESGLDARPMHPEWARELRDQCVAAGVPFFFKQWGEWCPQSVACSEKAAETALYLEVDGSTRDARFGTRGGSVTIQRVGKKAAGRILDGRKWDQFPVIQSEAPSCE